MRRSFTEKFNLTLRWFIVMMIEAIGMSFLYALLSVVQEYGTLIVVKRVHQPDLSLSNWKIKDL